MDLDFVLDGYLKESMHAFSNMFRTGKTPIGTDFVFIGQSDPSGKPNGIVRAIYSNGWIYEGGMTPSGLRNGFGVWYVGISNEVHIGWWKDSLPHGNYMCCDADKWAIEIKFQGWYKHGTKAGPDQVEDDKACFDSDDE